MTTHALSQRLEFIRRSLPETPVLQLADDRIDLFAKLEYGNPNGSAKDRSAFWILKRALERGEITEDTTIVESSSGNFAISLASFCRSLDLAFVPVIDPNVNAATEAYLRALCDRVEKVTERDASGGFLSTRLARVAQLRIELDSAYWPNQYANTDAIEAHYRLTGGELCRAFRRIDYLFVGVSTGGTIGGLSKRLKETWPRTRVIAVDAEGSAIFGGPPATRRIPGLGSSITPPLFEHALIDEVIMVPERETVLGCHQLLRQHGVYAGGSTGTVYTAINGYFDGYTGPRPTVVFLCADRGTGYADTIYNPLWAADPELLVGQ
ncbi:2,3-diaminopropionate biosynthesis protein SbnA [Solihabitans fulvus]|uniref:2,3-diaminopropionate biosynthesis protein SbnA n=1 Tax=Solihabitans fulvus TaxID=1892852 RepID=A0A5B2WU92_9PSEU|nr:2,3-diaminopropionate biosynthesis protein SbnA [Solihabitans fulvus]KAA2254440.1 2,3-diaminopropionate biosynthesis protein SbnA [Solihabitans fulvus]